MVWWRATLLAAALSAVGALNWGLVGLRGFNLVRRLSGGSRTAERIVYLAVGAAGAWLGLVVVLQGVLAPLSTRRPARPSAGEAPSIVGKRLPNLSGSTLGGQQVTLPEATAGKVAYLVLGFSYEARFEVEDWVNAFKERFGGDPEVTLYEVPVIGGLYRLFGPMIDEGMRQGTRREMWDEVVTVYGSQMDIRKALGAGPAGDTWVYLLDRDGTVVFQHGGAFDQDRFGELASRTEAALSRGGAPGRQEAA